MTPEQQKIAAYIDGRDFCAGIGNKESACALASINLALTGELTDDISDCVCPVIGSWVMDIQDNMTHDMRNAPAWRNLIPLLAGTKDSSKEQKRANILVEDLWDNVFPKLQEVVAKLGLEAEWSKVLSSAGEKGNYNWDASNALWIASHNADDTLAVHRLAYIAEAVIIIVSRKNSIDLSREVGSIISIISHMEVSEEIYRLQPALLAKLIAA